MIEGKVKWFNNAKGFGFINPIDSEQDLFVHYSSIQVEGYKTLKAGQRVQFQLKQTNKGDHAVDVAPCDEQADSQSTADLVQQPARETSPA